MTLPGAALALLAAGAGATAQAERLAADAMRLAAARPAEALVEARRALALTEEFEPTAFAAAGRRGEVVEDVYLAARQAYRRHRAGLYQAVGECLARAGRHPEAVRYLRRGVDLGGGPEAATRLARSLVALRRGSEALNVLLAGGAGALSPDALAVAGEAVDVAGLPSLQLEIDHARLAALGQGVEPRDGPFAPPEGARLSSGAPFRLDSEGITLVYVAEASCRTCSSDLDELARLAPAGAQVLVLPAAPDQDDALRRALALYGRKWPLVIGGGVARALDVRAPAIFAVARQGWSGAVVAAPFGAALPGVTAALGQAGAPERVPRPGWNGRKPERTPPQARPALLPDGLAPGEDEPAPEDFARAVVAYRGGLPAEALRLFEALEARGDGWLLPPEARLDRALCLAALGRREEARRLLLRTGDSRFQEAVDRALERVGSHSHPLSDRVGWFSRRRFEMPDAPTPHAIIETRFGEIELEFLSEKAPGHVKNFLDLARKGFYDGTTFHRVIPGFMIQGGDPTTKDAKARERHGTGGPGYTIKAEFNDTAHKRGVLSMARAQDPDSAGCQFFICVADSPFLDRQYTAFGRVVRGMEAADKIVAAPRDRRDNPDDRIEMKVRVLG